MEKKLTLLIYEKDFFLNSILTEQFLYSKNYQVFIEYDEKKLLEMINDRIFDILILNLEIINKKSSPILKNFKENNEHKNIVAYYADDRSFEQYRNSNISLLKKPFKFKTLLNYLDNIRNSDFIVKKNYYLMSHIQFIPIKKLIYNLHTHHKEYLTEKETYLLDYLNKNRNINIKKSDLLEKIWGVNQDINTHTLETHIYRLKLKLNKTEPNPSFSLLNQNGLYCMKDNIKGIIK